MYANEMVYGKNSIYIENGRYIARRNLGNNINNVCISNFTMRILYFIPHGGIDSRRIVKIHNINGEENTFVLFASEMVLNKFKKIIRSKGNFFFTGSQNDFDIILAGLQFNELKAEQITTLGHQKGTHYYAFSNGMLTEECEFYEVDELGIVSINDACFYFPFLSKFEDNSKVFNGTHNFIYKKGEIYFTSWFEHMYQLYDIKAVIGICYAFLTIFRDVVVNNIGVFPILFLHCEECEEASSFIEQLLFLFGNTGSGISLTISYPEKALKERVSQIRNSLCYLHGFTNSVAAALGEQIKIEHGRNSYDHANNLQRIDHFNNGLLITGDEMPFKDSAFYEKIILLDFSQDRFNTYQKNIFQELLIKSPNGLTHLFGELFGLRKEMEQNFEKRYQSIFQQINKPVFANNDLEKRTDQNIALFLAAFSIIDRKFKISQELTRIDLKITSFLNKQSSLWVRPKNLQSFWQMVEYLADTGKIKTGKDFIVKKEGNTRYLYIKFHPIYLLYLNCRKREKKPPLKKSPLLHLIKTDPSFIKSGQKGRVDTHTLKNIGSTYKFDYDTLNVNMQKLW